MSIFPYLKQYAKQYSLDKKQATTLFKTGRTRFIRRSEKLFYNDSSCKLYLVLKGKLKLMDCTDPETWIFKDILRPGDFFGDIALSNKKMADEYAEAMTTNALVCYFHIPDIRQMIKDNPYLALNFAATIATKLKRAEKRHAAFISKDTKERLVDFFQTWAQMDGVRHGDKLVLDNDLTLTNIAEYISTSRQTIYTILKGFRKSGLFQWNRKKIVICPSLWEKRK